MKRTSGGLGRKFLPGKLVKGLSQKDPLFWIISKVMDHQFGAHWEISRYSGGPVRHWKEHGQHTHDELF